MCMDLKANNENYKCDYSETRNIIVKGQKVLYKGDKYEVAHVNEDGTIRLKVYNGTIGCFYQNMVEII